MRYLISALVLVASCSSWAADYPIQSPYNYPIKNPYLATVVGTPEPLRADLPKDAKLTIRSLPLRTQGLPAAMWYSHRLQYSYRLQKGSAPLIFLIAGTGGFHDTGKNLPLLKAFYQAGFHVVGLTSPTHSQFVIAASTNGVTGHQRNDAQDLYRVMQEIMAEIDLKKGRVTGYNMAGYSLGASNAGFVAELDSRQKVFNFDKVLMIEPPLSIYSSISKLDRMLENIPGGMDNFNLFFENVVDKITRAYKQSSTVEFSPELVFDAFKESPPTQEELGALIGIAFRMASSSMVFASDQRTNFGFIKPSNVRLTKNTALERYGAVSFRVGFTDYYHEYFWPYYEPEYPDQNRESFVKMHSLYAIQDYLETNQNIAVFHNQDDIILEKGEIDFFPKVFGSRATIFPYGGHLGNMEFKENMAMIVGYFK
jgi:hypothetical protein